MEEPRPCGRGSCDAGSTPRAPYVYQPKDLVNWRTSVRRSLVLIILVSGGYLGRLPVGEPPSPGLDDTHDLAPGDHAFEQLFDAPDFESGYRPLVVDERVGLENGRDPGYVSRGLALCVWLIHTTWYHGRQGQR